MPDIKSTIRIEDGFTEPLQTLAKESYNATESLDKLTESIRECSDSIREDLSNSIHLEMKKNRSEFKMLNWVALSVAGNLKKAISGTLSSVRELSTKTIQNSLIKDLDKYESELKDKFVKIAEFKNNLDKLGNVSNLSSSRKDAMTEKYKDDIGLKDSIEAISNVKKHIADLNSEESIYKKVLNKRKNDLKEHLKSVNEIKSGIKKDTGVIATIKNSFKISKEFETYQDVYGGRARNPFSAFKESIKRSRMERKVRLDELKLDSDATTKQLKKNYDSLKKTIRSGKTDLGLEFSETLNLTKQAGFGVVKTGAGNLAKDIKVGASNMGNSISNTAARASRIGGKYAEIFNHTTEGSGIGNVANAIKQDASIIAKDLSEKTSTGLKEGIKNGWQKLKTSEGAKIAMDFGKEMGKIGAAAVIQHIAMAMFNKIKDGILNVIQASRQAIQTSLDDLDISNKFNSLYGENGNIASKRAYELANAIGEDAGKVSEMAARAAYQGIGSDDFERIMKLSDKIGKLSPMQTTESAASDLLSNIKSGHDAGSFAQMLGGGQKMERQLRRAGFERALNKGDINAALDIAEKITEQAGLTNEAYNKSSESMAEKYKKIENFVSNLKHELTEIYINNLEPAVDRVKELIESEKFQFVISVVKKGVSIIGKLVCGFIEQLIDWLPYLGVLFGAGLVAQSYLFIKNIGGIIGLLVEVKKGLISIAKLLGMNKIAGMLEGITVKQIKILAKQKAIAAVKVAAPWLLVAALVAGALKLMHHLFGEGKTFSEFLAGSIAGAWKMGINLAHNICAFFAETLPRYFDMAIISMKALFLIFVEFIHEKISDLFSWILKNVVKFAGPLGLAADAFGLTDDLAQTFQDRRENTTLKNNIKVLQDEFERLDKEKSNYVAWDEGVLEAFESNGKTMIEWLKKLFNQGEEANKTGKGIKTKTDRIARSMEQEEELRWLKAFSDRQIMQSYNSQTSNMSNVYFNGMSTAAVDAKARGFNPNRFPGRRKTA